MNRKLTVIVAGGVPIVWCGGWIAYEFLGFLAQYSPVAVQNILGLAIGAYLVSMGAIFYVAARRTKSIGNPSCSRSVTSPANSQAVPVADLEVFFTQRVEPLIREGFEKMESELKDQIIAMGMSPPEKKPQIPEPPEAIQ